MLKIYFQFVFQIGGGGNRGSVECPQRYYISSIYGRSGDKLDRLGIRCRHDTDMTSHGFDYGEFGGMGGRVFDDLDFSFGNRPIGISVRSGDYVDAIQIDYGSTYLPPLCIDCSRALLYFNNLYALMSLYRLLQDIERNGHRNMAVAGEKYTLLYAHTKELSLAFRTELVYT